MSQERKNIRVVIADDHLIVREGLRLILETTQKSSWWEARPMALRPFAWLLRRSRMSS